MSQASRTVYSLPPTCLAESVAPLALASAAALLETLRARCPATAARSEAVAELAGRVARELALDPVAVREVELTALLHEHGERVVRAMPGLWQIGPLVRACHERWDGLGYPDGLHGEEIPLASRIVVACDAYLAIGMEPGNQRALPQSVALAELADAAGSQLCPACAEALLAIVEGPFQRFRRRRGGLP